MKVSHDTLTRAARAAALAGLCAAIVPATGCASLKNAVQTAMAAVPSRGSSYRISPYGAADPKLTAPNPVGGLANPFLANGHAIERALNAIAAKSGRPMRLTNLTADTFNGLDAEVVEPRDHLHVDEYKVAIDGTLTGPFPVQLHGSSNGAPTVADVDYNSFDPKSFNLAGLSGAIRRAIVQSKVPDARASSWQIDRAWGELQWGVTMDGQRARPNIQLKPDATISNIGF